MSTPEIHIDHEVRIRMAEQSYSELKSTIKEIRDSIYKLDEKVDSHFKWTLGTMLGLFVGIIGIAYPVLAGIILHLAKLI